MNGGGPAPVWRVRWRNGRFTTPAGAECPQRWGDTPDLTQAHEALDRWAADTGIIGALPEVHGHSPWWLLRFHLAHTVLSALLPELRALAALRESLGMPPNRIELEAPPDWWWPGLVRVVFPESQVHASSAASGRLKRFRHIGARLLRAAICARRLRRLRPPQPGRPRVVVVSQSRYWDGMRDTELGAVVDALDAAGCEPLLVDTCHGDYVPRLHALRTRPKAHLFGDIFQWRYLRGRFPLPEWRGTPKSAPLRLEGLDLAPVVLEYIERHAVSFARGLAEYTETVPRFLHEAGAAAMVMPDENGGEHALKAGALLAGVPVIGMQHGCIHAGHLNYIYPSGTTPDSIPLCTHTCVYGAYEERLLTQHSAYARERIAVTGQAKGSLPEVASRPWGARNADGERLRARFLPPKCTRLLLFSSQDLLHAAAAGPLLDAFAASAPENYLIVRPHPREFKGEHWETRIARRALQGRARVASEHPLAAWLDACDVHLSLTSTVLSEAVLWGRPNIILDGKRFGDWLGCLAAGTAIGLEDYASLDAALAYWLDADASARKEFEARRQAYIEDHFYKIDGKAAERIAAVVADCIRQTRESA